MDSPSRPHDAPAGTPSPRRRRASSPDSLLDSRLIEQTLGRVEHLARWMGWRLRLLVVAALVGCLAVLLFSRWMAATPELAAEWRTNAAGHLVLASTTDSRLRPHLGHRLVSVGRPGRAAVAVDALAIAPSTRWIIDDTDRARQQRMHGLIDDLLNQPSVRLGFADGATVDIEPHPRGLASLGALYWLLMGLALVVYLVGMVVVLASPSMRTLL
ncbi:MAG: histidine kinase, partial [Rhizobacter sp.]